MALTVSFGYITADSRQIYKGYVPLYVADNSVKLLTPTNNVLTPVIEVHANAAGTSYNPMLWNYMYISEFGRYYYITACRPKIGSVFEIEGRVDVLTSFQSEILGLSALLLRSESNGADYTPDNQYPLYPYKDIGVVELDGGIFNINSATAASTNFVLNVAGGGTSGS